MFFFWNFYLFKNSYENSYFNKEISNFIIKEYVFKNFGLIEKYIKFIQSHFY